MSKVLFVIFIAVTIYIFFQVEKPETNSVSEIDYTYYSELEKIMNQPR